MDLMRHAPRLIGLAVVLAWWIFRLVKYLRMSGAKRAPRAAPTATAPPVATAPPAATASPIEPAGAAGVALARRLLAAAVLVPGTVAIWSLLFLVPALEEVPALPRMIGGVLATLYLMHLARSVAARSGGTGTQDNNPIK